jgi:hypothetical protein
MLHPRWGRTLILSGVPRFVHLQINFQTLFSNPYRKIKIQIHVQIHKPHLRLVTPLSDYPPPKKEGVDIRGKNNRKPKTKNKTLVIQSVGIPGSSGGFPELNMRIVHCVLYTVHCVLCIVYCALCTVQCVLCSVYCA